MRRIVRLDSIPKNSILFHLSDTALREERNRKNASESQGDWIGYKFSSKKLVHITGYLTDTIVKLLT